LVLGRERNLLALFGMRNNGFYDWLEKARRWVTVNATYHVLLAEDANARAFVVIPLQELCKGQRRI